MRRFALFAVLALAVVATPDGPTAARADQAAAPVAPTKPLRRPDVRYEPSPPAIARTMLEMAGVTARDVVYDLGSGDGRIPIAAARDFGARAIGIDIDPALVARARANARAAGVADRVTFRNEDLFEADIDDATVVTLFLYPDVNLKLRPKLLAELRPGTRVVSHWHDMGDWRPDRTIRTRGRSIYMWVIPERAGSD